MWTLRDEHPACWTAVTGWLVVPAMNPAVAVRAITQRFDDVVA